MLWRFDKTCTHRSGSFKLCTAGRSTTSSPLRVVVAFPYQKASDMLQSVDLIATWPAEQWPTAALVCLPWKVSLLHGCLPFKMAKSGSCWKERFWPMFHKFWIFWAMPATPSKTFQKQRTSCSWFQRFARPSRIGKGIKALCGATSLPMSSEAGQNVAKVDLGSLNFAWNLAAHRSYSRTQRALFDPMPKAAAENWAPKSGHSWGQRFEGLRSICTGGTCCSSSFTPQRSLLSSPM